jgi:hypothetical protein
MTSAAVAAMTTAAEVCAAGRAGGSTGGCAAGAGFAVGVGDPVRRAAGAERGWVRIRCAT